MLKLNGVSFIGIDHSTSFDQLMTLGNRERSFEFLEFGVLYSNSRMGTDTRYPSLDYINSFIAQYNELKHKPFYASIHLCGSSIGQFITQDKKILDLCNKFDRIQLNFSAADYPNVHNFYEDVFKSIHLMEDMDHLTAPFIVIQANKSKTNFIEYLAQKKDIIVPWVSTFHILFDGSGGFGRVLNDPLPPIEGYYNGYAGGLGPDTVEDIVNKIELVMPANQQYYIDMESKIRTDNKFDITKCGQVLDIIARMDNE